MIYWSLLFREDHKWSILFKYKKVNIFDETERFLRKYEKLIVISIEIFFSLTDKTFITISMTRPADAITAFNCFLVQKVSHHGSLCLFPKHLVFMYSNGELDKDANFEYTAISELIVETRLAHAMNNLEIRVGDQSFLFSGLHEAQAVKDLITLLQQTISTPKITYGFAHSDDNKVQWQDLENPILLCSITIPANIATVMAQIESKDSFFELLNWAGNEEIVMSEWVEKDGFKERIIDYNKLVVLPVLGKNLIKVSETHRLFDLGNKKAIVVISDLGKTPYADCFDPIVQMFFEDNGDKVEFVVKFEMLWSSEPFVKSIIQTKTTDEIRATYTQFGKQLVTELGGSTEEAENNEEENAEDDFSKTRKIYKISIIILIIFLLATILFKYFYKGKRLQANWQLYQILVKLLMATMFFMLLIFF
ncbi:hypothetical protein TRFO_06493 [Tritrichomonas foetus]|uniref:VASt domain-containing protein n=1 Tax=Tritrichomonas foetus TaxID=1144522 RepID=A0A1J4JZP8_9EUKA|nr:hypothetical protein TRFO_06493 [Tritrichomonas foetus]|eukprot:OHT04162.1 hypothetical protein TRFO_06493 [Tritrichomonas foetus]